MRKFLKKKSHHKNTQVYEGPVAKFINDPVVACGILVFALIALLFSVINFAEALYR